MTPESIAALARADVARALQEDLGSGDLTAALVPEGRRCRARILAREAAVLGGAPWAEAALRALDPTVSLTWLVAEETSRIEPCIRSTNWLKALAKAPNSSLD